MRDIIVYALIVLLYKVESRTFCDDPQCVCVNKDNTIHVSCYSHPSVLEANYNLSDNVTTLDLSRNNVTSIHPSIISNSLLQLLLNNNRIKEIATDAFRLPSLKTLDLSHNNLEFIHRDAFAGINNLEFLNLGYNQFSAFGNLNFYHLKLLREIVVDENDIGPSLEKHKLFEGGYELSNEIQSISLRNVSLNNNKYIFKGVKNNLKKLNLAQNNLTEIIDLPLNLEFLDLSSNPIKSISREYFADVIYLKVLKLNNILIEEVPNFAFHYLTSLSYLELEGNVHLRKVSPLTWGRTILKDQIDLFVESMSLRGSNLSSIDGRMEGIFKKIKRIDLRDNPWNCDCKIAWLQNVPIPKELNDFRCSKPKNLSNLKVLEVNSSQFLCVDTRPTGGYLNVIGIVAYCVLLSAAVIMLYFFIFSPKPFIYRQLPVEFPRIP